MGYRINLSNANSVGHLIEGNVISFLKQTLIDENYLEGNLGYLDNFFSADNDDFISSSPTRFFGSKNVLAKEWYEIRDLIQLWYRKTIDNREAKQVFSFEYSQRVVEYLKRTSNLLSGYQIKYFVLPGFEHNELNELLINRRELIKWLNIETFTSYLIIQLKEIPQKDNIQILDSFTHFSKALQRVDEWPGVLIWDKRFRSEARGIFIPIDNIEELREIFLYRTFERDYFKLLTNEFANKRKLNNTQLIHLSDLHLGTKNQEPKLLRLIEILKKHRKDTNSKVKIYPLISGDIIDSPSELNLLKYDIFENQIETIGFETPIIVLGNHDFFINGCIRTGQRDKNILHRLSARDSINVIEESKLIVLKFNSNTDGEWAQGKIGLEQLTLIGNRLDRIENLKSYCIIAMLHHHPFELDRPDWMKKTWYEQILGRINFDVNKANKLVDATTFINWIKERKIKFVVHGHKHIPMLLTRENLNIVSGGSSTGNIDHMDSDRTFITYNVINYDNKLKKPISSTIVFEDLLGAGTKHYQIMKY